MPNSLKLSSQSEAYWRSEYAVSPKDLDLITGIILEEGKPVPIERLAQAIVSSHYAQERAAAERLSSQAQLYRPMDEHQVGDSLTFTEMDMQEGEIVAIRDGSNPRYGEFKVAQVKVGSKIKEFASSFGGPHPLNRPVEELLGPQGDESMGEGQVIESFSPVAAKKLREAFEQDDGMVPFAGLWFLKELLPEIHIGHLNLAEAVIYEAGQAVTARDMRERLDLDVGGGEMAQLFALNHALEVDERFDDLGAGGEQLWYLSSLEPEAVSQIPTVLKPSFEVEGGEPIGLTLIDLIEELGDELDALPTETLRQGGAIAFQLNFGHRYAGTMPVGPRLLEVLGEDLPHHFPVTLVDRRKRLEIPAWVVPSQGYLCGLNDWYESVGATVGTQITVLPTNDGRKFEVRYAKPRSRRSEWLRSASAQDGLITIEVRPTTLAIRCDSDTVVTYEDGDAIAAVIAAGQIADKPLAAVVRGAFSELAKLSGQGLVHAKALYSVVNMQVRSGAAPILSYLTRNAAYDPVGEGLWAQDLSLVGQVYETLDDMRERPLSNRSDKLRDQVVEYQGI